MLKLDKNLISLPFESIPLLEDVLLVLFASAWFFVIFVSPWLIPALTTRIARKKDPTSSFYESS